MVKQPLFILLLNLKSCGLFNYWIDKFQNSCIVHAWNTSECVFSFGILCNHLLYFQKGNVFSWGTIEHTTHACLLYSWECRNWWSFTSMAAHSQFILSPCPQAFQLNSQQGTSSQYFIFSPQSHQDGSHHREDNFSQACGTHSPVAGAELVCPMPNKPSVENYGH